MKHLKRSIPWPCVGLIPLVIVVGCASTADPEDHPPGTSIADTAPGAGPKGPQEVQHIGPEVVEGSGGPGRFVQALYEDFDVDRAMDTVAFLDRYYREPANDGFNAGVDYLSRELGKAGYGKDARLELRELRTRMDLPAWTPRSARLSMLTPAGGEIVLHAFDEERDADRTMLPRNAPSAKVEGDAVFALADVREGSILVTKSSLRENLLRRAGRAGAAAVVSASLMSFNEDPTGAERHLDAIQYRVPRGAGGKACEVELPVAQISQRSFARLKETAGREGGVRLAFEAEVATEQRLLRTLVAVVVGDERPDEAVVTMSHLQEPGASDNASGVAGLLESARSLARLLSEGEVDWPARSLVFIWGDEMVQSRAWLKATRRQAICGISSDMTGQSRAKTGAIALLERMPDPGAVVVLPPDEHTPWGSQPVEADSLRPNGLNVVARCAIADVARIAGGWETREHPWEGGSDHDVFIDADIPAVLFWHFTDFTYHTSLDRIEYVDPGEIQRTGVALLASALSVADPLESDLGRYLECVKMEEELRIAASASEGDDELKQLWIDWCKGARDWLRAQCLGLSGN